MSTHYRGDGGSLRYRMQPNVIEARVLPYRLRHRNSFSTCLIKHDFRWHVLKHVVCTDKGKCNKEKDMKRGCGWESKEQTIFKI
mmetsp:Transcript_21645/g.26804  ORF Transcript_21645/g.26804 Transcript_21645/m.26804 type:complete len:84 (+) Transcript_21645:114-365(+)